VRGSWIPVLAAGQKSLTLWVQGDDILLVKEWGFVGSGGSPSRHWFALIKRWPLGDRPLPEQCFALWKRI